MSRRIWFLVVSWLVLGVLSPTIAGAGWPLDKAAEVTLGYAVSYPFGDGESVHRGIDLAAATGDTVLAPFAGRVSFAGRVPAQGGGTCGAVTIEFGDGLKLTCLPLDDVRVSAGTLIEGGSIIGLLAASGDRSSSAPHLHIGVRRGDAYLDPMGFLVPPPIEPAAEAPATSVPQGGSISEGVPSPVASAFVAVVPAPVVVGSQVAGNVPVARTDIPHITSVAVPDGAPAHAAVTPKPYVQGSTAAPGDLVGMRRLEHVERALSSKTRMTAGTHTGVIREAGVTHARSAAAAPTSVPGILLIGAGALLGLSPVWRSQSHKPQRSAVPAGDDFAAAVGR
ncbi:MAG: M23 family metallopeptidase [Coriobacteriia bacterium]|nr:M23 family metallopeptidase [Coriobacteriia bacterium]